MGNDLDCMGRGRECNLSIFEDSTIVGKDVDTKESPEQIENELRVQLKQLFDSDLKLNGLDHPLRCSKEVTTFFNAFKTSFKSKGKMKLQNLFDSNFFTLQKDANDHFIRFGTDHYNDLNTDIILIFGQLLDNTAENIEYNLIKSRRTRKQRSKEKAQQMQSSLVDNDDDSEMGDMKEGNIGQTLHGLGRKIHLTPYRQNNQIIGYDADNCKIYEGQFHNG